MHQNGISKIDKVKALVQANGGWRRVYNAYSGLDVAIRAADKSRGRNPPQVPCPLTGQGKTKFRLFKDWEETGGGYHNDQGPMADGLEVIAFMEGNKSRALDVITSVLGGDLRQVTRQQIRHAQVQAAKVREYKDSDEQVAAKKAKLNALFQRSTLARDSQLVVNYLHSRGLMVNPENLPHSLGFANPLWYAGQDTDRPIKLCGMLGVMTNKQGKKVTIHRTFLDPATGYKAKVEQPKLLMAPPEYIGGCSIKLDPPEVFGKGFVIGLAEGIETALAVREATGMPMWSCYSNTLLELVELPDEVTDVVIWGDKDRSGAGQRSAAILAERLSKMGIRTYVMIPRYTLPPDAKSVDWLDVYVKHGSKALFEHLKLGQKSTECTVSSF